MPICACDVCKRFYVVDRDDCATDPCPSCSGAMRPAAGEEARKVLRELREAGSDRGRSATPDEGPQEPPAAGNKGGELRADGWVLCKDGAHWIDAAARSCPFCAPVPVPTISEDAPFPG